MAKSVIADAGLLVALIEPRERHHDWAVAQSKLWPPPWLTCESVLSETFFTCDVANYKSLSLFLSRGVVQVRFDLQQEIQAVVALIEKYRDIPMSLADACLVRMSEIHPDPIVLTTDSDFRIYRRHSRQVVPCSMP